MAVDGCPSISSAVHLMSAASDLRAFTANFLTEICLCVGSWTNFGKAKKSEGKMLQQHISVTGLKKNRFVRLVVFSECHARIPC